MYLVSIGQQLLVLDGTGSVHSNTGRYLVEFGQYRYWFILVGSKSVEGLYAITY